MASLVHLSLSDTAKSSEFLGVFLLWMNKKSFQNLSSKFPILLHCCLCMSMYHVCLHTCLCIICPFLKQSLEMEMATHSSVLAWRIPAMGEPGGLPSMGLHRVGRDWSDLAAAAAKQSLAQEWYYHDWLQDALGICSMANYPNKIRILLKRGKRRKDNRWGTFYYLDLM